MFKCITFPKWVVFETDTERDRIVRIWIFKLNAFDPWYCCSDSSWLLFLSERGREIENVGSTWFHIHIEFPANILPVNKMTNHMHSSTSLFIDHPLTNQEVGQRPYRGPGEGANKRCLTISRLRNNFRDSETKVFRTGSLSHIWCRDYLPARSPPNQALVGGPSHPPLLYSHIWLTGWWVKNLGCTKFLQQRGWGGAFRQESLLGCFVCVELELIHGDVFSLISSW